jgi:hypothetical protein
MHKKLLISSQGIKKLLISSLMMLAFAGLAQAQSGLLLGLRSTKNEYRTLYLSPAGGKWAVLERPDLIAPRRDGFWRVGMGRLKTGSGDWVNEYDTLWAHRIGQPNWFADYRREVLNQAEPKVGERSNEDSSRTILFVGQDVICAEFTGGGYGEGAAHPWAGNTLEAYRIDTIAKPAGTAGSSLTLAIDDALPEAAKTFTSAGEAFHATLPSDRAERVNQSPSETEWALVRRQGRWVLRGRLNYAYEAVRGSFEDFSVPYTLPKAMVGPDTLRVPWNTVKARIPAALDAFSSPNGEVLGVLTKTTLTLYTVRNGSLGPTVFSRTLRAGEAAVMIHWALGNSVSRWQREISAIR